MEKLISSIIEKLLQIGYTEKNAHSLAERLAAETVIRDPLKAWLSNGIETDCAYEEFTALKLVKERNFTYPNALSTIAWLHRDPHAARKALSGGVDTIRRSGDKR